MKLDSKLLKRKIRLSHWPQDEWVQPLYLGVDFVVAKNEKGKEIVFIFDKFEQNWQLLNSHIPLNTSTDEEIEQEFNANTKFF